MDLTDTQREVIVETPQKRQQQAPDKVREALIFVTREMRVDNATLMMQINSALHRMETLALQEET